MDIDDRTELLALSSKASFSAEVLLRMIDKNWDFDQLSLITAIEKHRLIDLMHNHGNPDTQTLAIIVEAVTRDEQGP